MLKKNKKFNKSKKKPKEVIKARNRKLRLEDRSFIKHKFIDRQIENEER